MDPYASFLFFGLMLLYVIFPTLVLGLFGRANWRWTLFVTVGVLIVQFWGNLALTPKVLVPELGIACLYALYQGAITLAFSRWRTRATFYVAVGLVILPLVTVKVWPLLVPDGVFGFLGISYVTFRALDVIFSLRDRVITAISPSQYLAFLFFFPTISSGPIDRYRRFGQDWNRLRGRHEFLDDLDAAVQRVFQGFLYKFIIAALLRTKWVDVADKHPGALETLSYMYAYTFYLFFDFAGYSAFAIGFSRLFGIRTPENFDRPFLSKNIRDFWNRWHISLSFWFRDHVYMRFLLTAAKGKWFKGKHTASFLGLYLTFGIMGLWHGLEGHYIVYGLYHATLLVGYDIFTRWNKQAKVWKDGFWWRVANIVLTFHVIAFGLLIFSGRLSPRQMPRHEEIAEKIDCQVVSGYVWDILHANDPLHVDVYVDEAYVGRAKADRYVDELKRRGYGNGAKGFEFQLPGYVRDGKTHTIEAKVVESGIPLRGSPEQVVCPHP